MKILIVGSLNSHGGKFAPFIVEQADALRAAGCGVTYYGVTGKGVKGYLHGLKDLRLKILSQILSMPTMGYADCWHVCSVACQ